MRPLGGHPVVEPGSAGDAESLEEHPRDQPGGRFVVTRGAAGVELLHVQRHRPIGQADMRPVRLEALARVGPQRRHGLVERVPGVFLRLIAPQQPDQVVAGPRALGRPGEVNEQREILVPLQAGGHAAVVEPDHGRAQRLAADHATSRQRRAVARTAALSARAR